MGNIIEILDNVIVMDDQHYISRYNNSVMSKNSKGIVFVNGNEQLQVAYEGTTIDGDDVTSIDDLFTKLQSLFKSNSGSGGGAVESVTGDGVDNTDPSNPVISYPPEVTWTTISGKPAFIASGANATAARTSLGLGTAATTASTAYATAAQGALAATALQPADASNVSAADKVVRYSNIGAVNTAIPQFPENAVPLVLLDLRIPSAPASGTYTLKSVDGVVSWVSE